MRCWDPSFNTKINPPLTLTYYPPQETGLIDYDRLAELASLFKPALLICGGSAYPREWDYKR